MWKDRNSYVHKPGRSVHQVEEEAINEAIPWEFDRGRDGLPCDFQADFDGEVGKLVGISDTIKK